MTDMLLIAGWCFAVSLFLPLFVWTLMPLLPRCAATRHLVWLALFGTLLVLPLLALVVPPQIVLPQASGADAAPVAVAVRHGWSMADTISLLILAWLLGTGFHLARLALGLFGLHRLRRGSVPFDGPSNVRLADDGPLAFGLLSPLILLPHDAAHWPQARLDMVLAHERAHLRRRDSFTQMLAQLACAFYWPNPLLWLAARSMRHQAEIAADNAALAGGIRASDYAAELLQLAGQSLRLPAAAMAAPSLEARVKSVLSPLPWRNGMRVLDVFRIVWLGSAAAVALALVRPAVAQAQDAVSPPAPPRTQAAPVAAQAPVPDAPPAPDLPPAPPPRPAQHHHHHIAITVDARLSDADKAKIDAAVAQVQATMTSLRPEIERAMQQARADRAASQSVQQVMPQVHAAIAQAMAQIKPVVHQAFVNERVDVKVTLALDHAQAQIEAAMARAEHDAEHAATHAKVHGRDENPDRGDINPNP